jgi:hypothetical protein
MFRDEDVAYALRLGQAGVPDTAAVLLCCQLPGAC